MKTTNPLQLLAAFAGMFLLTGCVGYNTTFFGTKTNLGLDLDTKTPTAEISIARREVVVAPTFENGQTPPVEASFQVSGAWIASSVSSTFAGGNAAATFAELYDAETPTGAAKKPTDSTLKVKNVPLTTPGGREVHLVKPGIVRPFVFGTDTSLGIKAAWSGLTAQYPDSVKVGFNRKEMALAPVTGRVSPTNAEVMEVKMPSFLATTDMSGKTETMQKSDFRYTQYFATGDAADQLALQKGIRVALAKRLDPTALAEARLAKDREEAKGDVLKAQEAVDQVPAAKIDGAIDLFAQAGWMGAPRIAALKAQAGGDLPGVKKDLKESLDRHGRSGDSDVVKKIREITEKIKNL